MFPKTLQNSKNLIFSSPFSIYTNKLKKQILLLYYNFVQISQKYLYRRRFIASLKPKIVPISP